MANVEYFWQKQRHEANELKTCRTAFNLVPGDSHQTISNFKIGSTEIRCKLSLLSKIIEPNSRVDILTKSISLNRKKKALLSNYNHPISSQIKQNSIEFRPFNLLRR